MSSSGGVGRSIGAVVAGIVVGLVLTLITDVALPCAWVGGKLREMQLRG
jgi:branched-subunit amino acid ABC-type transport system permease component